MLTLRRISILTLTLGSAAPLLFGLSTARTSEDGEHFEFASYLDVENYFEELGDTPDTWLAGDRSVPRLFLTQVPERWRDKYSKEVTVQSKKRIFFRVLAPPGASLQPADPPGPQPPRRALREQGKGRKVVHGR